jgi:hypothetical protein
MRQQWMQMYDGSDKVKWTTYEWPNSQWSNGHVTRRSKIFIVVDVPQSMVKGSVLHLANNAEDEVRMVISAGCARSEAWKVNNQE